MITRFKEYTKDFFTDFFELSPKNELFTFQWHILEDCNLRCSHCYQEERLSPMSLSNMKLVLDKLNVFIKDLKKERKSNKLNVNIVITGGEPLLHPNFWDLIKMIKAKGFMFTVLTNGTLITETKAKRLANLKPYFVQVSIDGNEKIHDSIRGTGNYKKAVIGLKYLISENITTSVSFTVHKNNMSCFKDVVKLGEGIGVDRIWADRLIPTGSGTNLEIMTKEETQKFYYQMGELSKRLRERGTKTRISMGRALQFLNGGTPYRCNAGNMLLTLLPNGELLPCRRMPLEVGNILEKSISHYYYKKDGILKILRDQANPKKSNIIGCKKCEHYNKCNGGLRCLSNAVNLNPFIKDPGCWLKSE